MDIMEKIRTMSKKVMVILAGLVFLLGVIDLILTNNSDPQPFFVVSTFSVIFGICNFAVCLALAAVTFLKKADLKNIVFVGIAAIGEFVIALIMTNFTNLESFFIYVIKNASDLESANDCVYAPLILSMVFAAAVISAAVRAIKNDSVGTYTPAAYNGQQTTSDQMANMQVPTPQNDKDNINNNMQ